MKIKEVFVVEGSHDETRLKQIFDCDVIVTNGSAINKKTLELIKNVAKTRGIIVFTDPDHPGERIRKIITQEVKEAKHAFIKKYDAIDYQKNKIGVEHASDAAIIQAVEDLKSFSDNETLTWKSFIQCGLVGSSEKRNKITDYYKIPSCNAKTLYKRLNMMGVTYQELLELCGDKDE